MSIQSKHYVPSDMNDLKFALRQLRKSPGFSALAIATLALGIGLNTSIFSLVNDLFLRDLPFKEPGRVVHMYSNARERKLLELESRRPAFSITAMPRQSSTVSARKTFSPLL